MPIRSAVAALALLHAAPPALAQDPAPVAVPDVEPPAADVESIDGIVAAFYEVVSGPVARTISKQEYVDRADPWLVKSGFVEREIHREARRFGAIAHVWSTYEWSTDDGSTGRGINGIHLVYDGARWWISHASWDSKREGLPIPAEYLP